MATAGSPKKLLLELGVPDLSPEAVTERARTAQGADGHAMAGGPPPGSLGRRPESQESHLILRLGLRKLALYEKVTRRYSDSSSVLVLQGSGEGISFQGGGTPGLRERRTRSNAGLQRRAASAISRGVADR